MPIRRPARHRSRRAQRIRVLWAVPLLAAALAAGFYLTRGSTAGPAQAAFPQPAAGNCAAPGSPPGAPESACPRPSTSGRGVPAIPATTLRQHRRHASRPPQSPPAPPPTRTAPPSPAPPATSPGGGQPGTAAARVLAFINAARSQAGLPAYTFSSGLDRSSAGHNARMAHGCGLSHQCPGEPSLGTRETDAGVHWTSAGENIGDGGPVASTDSAIAQMAITLTRDMLDEKPPDDGHRLNILSSVFRHIGIAVRRDSHGIVWLTQDFSN